MSRGPAAADGDSPNRAADPSALTVGKQSAIAGSRSNSPNRPMNLPTEIFGDVIVVHTPEELGSDQSEEFESCLPTLERKSVVLDLDNTESIDSKGLTALVSAQERLREEGGEIKIASTNATNRKIFEITRLDQQLEVYESVIDAVKSFH